VNGRSPRGGGRARGAAGMASGFTHLDFFCNKPCWGLALAGLIGWAGLLGLLDRVRLAPLNNPLSPL